MNAVSNQNIVEEAIKSLFKKIIGQTNPKRELGFYLSNYWKTRIMPNLLVIAPKGQGKTTTCTEIAKGLFQFDEEGKHIVEPNDKGVLRVKKKPFVVINCSTLTTVKQFINSVIIPYVADKDVTIFFDEASEIPHDIVMALLTILNPTREKRTTFSYNEYVCDFDFRRQTFLFATSESHKMFHALADRLERVTLQEYSLEDMANIVKIGSPDVEFQDGVLDDIAPVLRGNARAAIKMAEKIESSLVDGKGKFGKKEWNNICHTLSIMPLGLNAMEIQVMRILETHMDGVSLTSLSSKLGMSRESLQKDIELYLLKHNLIEIQTTGRTLTIAGRQYLKDLN